jgi:hypothetical protein
MRISLNALHFSESDFPKEFINQPHQYQINKAPYTKTENTFSAAFFWEGGDMYTILQFNPHLYSVPNIKGSNFKRICQLEQKL